MMTPEMKNFQQELTFKTPKRSVAFYHQEMGRHTPHEPKLLILR